MANLSAERYRERATSSPMMPRRKASTQITKIRPVTMVTDSPIVLNHSICVTEASQVPTSPSLFSRAMMMIAPSTGPNKVPIPPTSVISTTQQGVFAGLPAHFTVNRYHSLAIERASCPAELEITAWTDDGEIMGVRHKRLAIQGVQFHPESILTEHGHAMLKNFLVQA